MSYTLYHHPLASFCWKVVMALHEAGLPYEDRVMDLSKAEHRDELDALWPVGKFPVLRDTERGVTVPESSIIIEHLSRHEASAAALLPADVAIDVRLWDRVFDCYVQWPMQKIVGDRLRPDGAHDAHGVEEAHGTLRQVWTMLEKQLAGHAANWIVGERFTMADCAAMPALFYASMLEPFPADAPRLAAYFERLVALPSAQRVLDAARPFFPNFPFRERIPARFLAP